MGIFSFDDGNRDGYCGRGRQLRPWESGKWVEEDIVDYKETDERKDLIFVSTFIAN